MAQSQLAPTGTLRAAFLGGNPSLGRVNAQTGAVTGPVADLVKEIARRLGVPYTLIPVPDAREVTARLLAHSADVGFMAYNAGRAAAVDFTAPWLLMPNSYLVRADSPIMKVADADRAGVRIIAAKNDTQDKALRVQIESVGEDLSGIVIFEWMDEWWKAGNTSTQDQDIEEYWGILTWDRKPKPGFESVSILFNSIPTDSLGYSQPAPH